MKYKVTINDCPQGWVKKEETNNRTRLFELRKQAHERARECVKAIGPESVKNHHFVYYYEMDERIMGRKTGNVLVWVYMLPYRCDDERFFDWVDEFKPYSVGAIHGDNLCSKFFEN